MTTPIRFERNESLPVQLKISQRRYEGYIRLIVVETQQKLKLIEKNILKQLIYAYLNKETYDLKLLRIAPENEYDTFEIKEVSKKDNSLMILIKKEEKEAWIRIIEGHDAWIIIMKVKKNHDCIFARKYRYKTDDAFNNDAA